MFIALAVWGMVRLYMALQNYFVDYVAAVARVLEQRLAFSSDLANTFAAIVFAFPIIILGLAGFIHWFRFICRLPRRATAEGKEGEEKKD
jgi:hypothetical protein